MGQAMHNAVVAWWQSFQRVWQFGRIVTLFQATVAV